MHKFNVIFDDAEWDGLVDIANAKSYTINNPSRTSIAELVRRYVRAGIARDRRRMRPRQKND